MMKKWIWCMLFVLIAVSSFPQFLQYYYAPSGRSSWLMPSLSSPLSYTGYHPYGYTSYGYVSPWTLQPRLAYPALPTYAHHPVMPYYTTSYYASWGGLYGWGGYTVPPIIHPGYSSSFFAPYWGGTPLLPAMPYIYGGW